MKKFNELFPNKIGDDLGQFHYEQSDISEGIFIGKGVYALKKINGDCIFKNMSRRITDPNWDKYLSTLSGM